MHKHDDGQYNLWGIVGRETTRLGLAFVQSSRKDGRPSQKGKADHGLSLHVPSLQKTPSSPTPGTDNVHTRNGDGEVQLYLGSGIHPRGPPNPRWNRIRIFRPWKVG